MEQQNQPEEVDLRMIFHSFRRGYHRVLISFYRMVNFLLKKAIWLILILLITFGVGWYLDSQKKPSYKSTAVVQINFETVNSVYENIELLQSKLEDGDEDFLKKHGIIKDNRRLISSIKIKPIINFEEVIFKNEYYNDRYLQNIFEKSKFKEDLLTSEALIQNYKQHKIEISSRSKNSEEILQALFTYLNSNELLNQIKEVRKEAALNEVDQNKKSVAAIDSILFALGSTTPKNPQNQVYFNQNQNTELHLLVEAKNDLLVRNQKLSVDLLKYDEVVKLLNQPEFTTKTNLIKQKKIVYPLAMILSLCVLFMIRYFYLKGKKMDAAYLNH